MSKKGKGKTGRQCGLELWENLNVKNQTLKSLQKLMEEYLNALKMGYGKIHKYDKKALHIQNEGGKFHFFKI